MNDQNTYTQAVLQNLGNGIEDCSKAIMNNQLSLLEFVDVWLELFKKNSIKTSSYNRLLVSRDAMNRSEGYSDAA